MEQQKTVEQVPGQTNLPGPRQKGEFTVHGLPLLSIAITVIILLTAAGLYFGKKHEWGRPKGFPKPNS